MQIKKFGATARLIPIIILVILMHLVIFTPGVLAQDSPVDIIDIDDQHGDGYTREVSSNGSSIYHWTLFNDDPQNYTYDITIQTNNSNTDWSIQLNPTTTISLSPGGTESITLTVFSPAGKTRGSTEVTLTFIIQLLMLILKNSIMSLKAQSHRF